ncbi:hypothetical protein Leryth_008525, partial [Lithospermum erythrorhizon]
KRSQNLLSKDLHNFKPPQKIAFSWGPIDPCNSRSRDRLLSSGISQTSAIIGPLSALQQPIANSRSPVESAKLQTY